MLPISTRSLAQHAAGWQCFVFATLGLWLCSASAWSQSSASHKVLSNGHPIALWAKKPAIPKTSIVLVHGRTWSGRPDFDLQVPGEALSLMDGLVAAGFATYAVDLRGYGATPRDTSGWLTPNLAATDLKALLAWVADQHPELPPPHLFGWSYGALVSQLTVQQQPDLVTTLTLFGYPLRPGISGDNRVEPRTPPARANTATNAASDFIVPGSISAAGIAGFVKAALDADPIRADWRALHQWRSLDPKRITVPTLLLEAEFDPLALDAVHAEFFSQIRVSDKQWTRLPGGDHAAFMETPRQAFLEVMTSFMQRPR